MDPYQAGLQGFAHSDVANTTVPGDAMHQYSTDPTFFANQTSNDEHLDYSNFLAPGMRNSFGFGAPPLVTNFATPYLDQTVSPVDIFNTPSQTATPSSFAVSPAHLTLTGSTTTPTFVQQPMFMQDPAGRINGLPNRHFSLVDQDVGETISSRLHQGPPVVDEEVEIIDDDDDRCYASILADALRSRRDRTMPLKALYEYMKIHSRKAKAANQAGDFGWQNSVRHNLSMNEAFERVDSGGNKKSSLWRLTDRAFTHGVQSTTRFRKAPKHPKKKSSQNTKAVNRQQSGAKGGRATKAAAARRKQEELQRGAAASAPPTNRSLRSQQVPVVDNAIALPTPQLVSGEPQSPLGMVNTPTPFGNVPYYGGFGEGLGQYGLSDMQQMQWPGEFDNTMMQGHVTVTNPWGFDSPFERI